MPIYWDAPRDDRHSLEYVQARALELYDSNCFALASRWFERAAVLARQQSLRSVERENLEAAYYCNGCAGGEYSDRRRLFDVFPEAWRTVRRRPDSHLGAEEK